MALRRSEDLAEGIRAFRERRNRRPSGDQPSWRGRKPLARERPIGERAREIIGDCKDAYPNATVALKFTNPLEMLVATILSAQCTDERVNQVTATACSRSTGRPRTTSRVPEEELAEDIKPTGFFNKRRSRSGAPAQRIVEDFGGRVPRP